MRNRDGSLSVRTTITIEGETVRRQVNVSTRDSGVAKARGKRLAAGDAPELLAAKSETFQEAAERLMAASTLRTAIDRKGRLKKFVYPVIGEMPVADIKVADVKACLAKVEETLGWTGVVRHTKNDVSAILGALYSDGAISENAALRISFRRKDGALGGRKLVRVILPRVVLSDEEFERFIEHGLEVGEGQLSELYMLALCARCLGGMRTSDLHAWRWEHIDTRRWLEAGVPRPKTQGQADDFEEGGDYRLEPYELTGEGAAIVPHLSAWWRRNGCPSEGPVFPVRRGRRAGQSKDRGTSYAGLLRDAVWAAGIARPLPGFEQAKGEDRKRFCALQSGVARRRACLDFHSFRRAWVTATTSAPGVSLGESMRLADHSDARTHMGYRRDDSRRVIPRGVLPRLPAREGVSAAATAKPSGHPTTIPNDYGRARRDLNSRPTASEAAGHVSPRGFTDVFEHDDEPVTGGNGRQRQNSLPKPDALRAAVDALLALGQTEMASALLAQPKAPVVRLASVRTKRTK